MCHLSLKLSDMLDRNPMYTSDIIVVKPISVKETHFKFDLRAQGQGHSKKQNTKGNKKYSTS